MASTRGIKLDETTNSRLKALGEKRGRSPHWLMKAAIEKFLDEAEAYEKEKSEDTARWERYVITGNAIDHKELEPWLKDLTQNRFKPWQQ